MNKLLHFLDKALTRMFDFLEDHRLHFCVRCGRLIFEKDANYEQHNTGRMMILCEKCHDDLYNPFTKVN